jgi:DNA helicase IV
MSKKKKIISEHNLLSTLGSAIMKDYQFRGLEFELHIVYCQQKFPSLDQLSFIP